MIPVFADQSQQLIWWARAALSANSLAHVSQSNRLPSLSISVSRNSQKGQINDPSVSSFLFSLDGLLAEDKTL
jgi:hypothetical protein